MCGPKVQLSKPGATLPQLLNICAAAPPPVPGAVSRGGGCVWRARSARGGEERQGSATPSHVEVSAKHSTLNILIFTEG